MGMPIILDPVEDESTARSFNQQELQTLAVAAAAAPSMHSTAAPPALPPRHPYRRPPRHQLHQSQHYDEPPLIHRRHNQRSAQLSSSDHTDQIAMRPTPPTERRGASVQRQHNCSEEEPQSSPATMGNSGTASSHRNVSSRARLRRPLTQDHGEDQRRQVRTRHETVDQERQRQPRAYPRSPQSDQDSGSTANDTFLGSARQSQHHTDVQDRSFQRGLSGTSPPPPSRSQEQPTAAFRRQHSENESNRGNRSSEQSSVYLSAMPPAVIIQFVESNGDSAGALHNHEVFRKAVQSLAIPILEICSLMPIINGVCCLVEDPSELWKLAQIPVVLHLWRGMLPRKTHLGETPTSLPSSDRTLSRSGRNIQGFESFPEFIPATEPGRTSAQTAGNMEHATTAPTTTRVVSRRGDAELSESPSAEVAQGSRVQ